MFTHFQLACYKLTLQAIEPLHLQPYKGSALRGGFGHTFKKLTCFNPGACTKICTLGNECPYGYIFETTPPEQTEVLSNFEGIPRPFVIQSPENKSRHIEAGERLTFGLTLVGQAIKYLAYFVLVFRELGQVGLGRSRGKYFLASMEAIHPYTRQTEPVYLASDDMVRSTQLAMAGTALTTHAATLPTDRITLNFLTPTRLKHRGRWVNEGPPFEVLIRTLLGRISSLSYFHCGHRFETDFRGLIDRAAGVQVGPVETRWEDWSRFSGRQKQKIKMGGLTGRVTYSGDLQPFLPLLVLGEYIHAGKGTVFGNGQYRIERGDRDRDRAGR